VLRAPLHAGLVSVGAVNSDRTCGAPLHHRERRGLGFALSKAIWCGSGVLGVSVGPHMLVTESPQTQQQGMAFGAKLTGGRFQGLLGASD